MKKLNMKSILALLLTLCMLLGSVAALAEGEAAAPAADAAAAATEPTPAAPIGNTEVTFAADPTTANTVDVTITDASTDSANEGINVGRYGDEYVRDPETGVYKATGDSYAMSVHESTAMIDLDEQKLLQNNDNMNLTFGGDTVNLTKPTEQQAYGSVYDSETGKYVYGKVTIYDNDATALNINGRSDVVDQGTLTVTGGDVYAGTSAKVDNDNDLYATAVDIDANSDKTKVDVTVDSATAVAKAPATEPAEGQKAEDVKDTLGAKATDISESAYNGGEISVTVKNDSFATAEAKNGSAIATNAEVSARTYSSWKDGKEVPPEKLSQATLTMGNGTATATSASGYAETNGFEAYATQGALNVTAGNLTGTATGAEDGYAYGAYTNLGNKSTAAVKTGDITVTATGTADDAYASGSATYVRGTATVENGAITATANGGHDANANGVNFYTYGEGTTASLKTGAITATATLTGKEDEKKEQMNANATGADLTSNNSTTTAEINGDVNVKSSQDAVGVTVEASVKRVENEEGKEVAYDKGSITNATLTGNVIVEGGAIAKRDKTSGNRIVGLSVWAGNDNEYDEKNKAYKWDKLGGEATLTMTGNVLVKGSETLGMWDTTTGIEASATTNAKATVNVTGDVAATGTDAVGLRVAAMKDSKLNVLVDGTLSGDGDAIAVRKSDTVKQVCDGEVVNKDEPWATTEYDPSAANIYVWAAKENALGRIATVYSDEITQNVKKVTEKYEEEDDDGNVVVYEDTWYEADGDSTLTRTIDAEASAKLEAAIWYIAKVADKWQNKITVTGTGTYTAGDTTYQVAHQNDDVKLSFKVPHGKKLKAIMYDDGTKAEYVKNEDGTYTIKMQRGGGMLLSLKFKKKAQQKAAAAAASTEGEAESTNWAYGVEIENVGTVYYGRDYFAQKDKDIINPLTKEAYTKDEIKAIVDGAKKGAEGYKFDIPEEAWLGMNDFWYDKDAALAIVGHEDELTIGDDGVFTTADGEEVAKPIKK